MVVEEPQDLWGSQSSTATAEIGVWLQRPGHTGKIKPSMVTCSRKKEPLEHQVLLGCF